jgi:hypothetical protein
MTVYAHCGARSVWSKVPAAVILCLYKMLKCVCLVVSWVNCLRDAAAACAAADAGRLRTTVRKRL